MEKVKIQVKVRVKVKVDVKDEYMSVERKINLNNLSCPDGWNF